MIIVVAVITNEEGQVTAWSKDKYNLFQHNDKKSFVADCAIAVMEVKENCCSKDDFIRDMEERGWSVTWSESKKHITFQDENGDKVRDSNLSKTFSLDISKEVLLNEFERQNEIRLARAKADRDKQRADQLDKYYAEVESAIQRTGTSGETIGSTKDSNRGERQSVETGETRGSGKDTESFIRDIKSEICDNRNQNRTVADTENKSISSAKQRRIEEQQRIDAEKQAERTARKNHECSGFSR